jgi:hypothetical protein
MQYDSYRSYNTYNTFNTYNSPYVRQYYSYNSANTYNTYNTFNSPYVRGFYSPYTNRSYYTNDYRRVVKKQTKPKRQPRVQADHKDVLGRCGEHFKLPVGDTFIC